MSISTLIQVHEDVRRLAIAGSSVAPGDFRLKKLIAPLEQAGAKAPVFAKIAQCVQALVDSSEQTAATALLELNTLVSAVLYTQGTTGIEGELTQVPSTDLAVRATQISARTIKPLLESLSSAGSGRLEIIQGALKRKMFSDLRLVRPALQAIDDPYPEIAELIAEQVLPLYGMAIFPELQASFDVKSKAQGQVRRLRVMHQLDAATARALVEQSLAEGSKELKVAAIECLGDSEADRAHLLEQAKARVRDVRAAALCTMIRAPQRSAEALATLLKAIEGEDAELLISTLNRHRVAELDVALIAQLDKAVERALEEKDPKKLGLAIKRAMCLIEGLDERKDEPCEQVLLALFSQRAKLAKLKAEPSGTDLNEAVAWCMSLSSEAAKRHLADHAASTTGDGFQAALNAAFELYTPEQFFDTFHPCLNAFKAKKRGEELQRAEALALVLQGDRTRGFGHMAHLYVLGHKTDDTVARITDPRWLDQAVAVQHPALVGALLRPEHEAAMAFLSAYALGKEPMWSRMQALEALAKFGHPNAIDLLIKLLLSNKSDEWQLRHGLGRIIPGLSASAIAALEAVIAKISPSLAEIVIEAISQWKLQSEGQRSHE